MSRRKQFEPGDSDHPLTPLKLRMLIHVADYSLLTAIQMGKITGMSYKAVTGHLRDLFDLKLVDRIAVPRAAFVDAPNDWRLAFGRAPTIYKLSREGAKNLVQSGILTKENIGNIPDYGPKNSLFLAHELQIRDVRIFLEQASERYAHAGIGKWLTGAKAEIGRVKPDAWFTYTLREFSFFAFVEVDRDTERKDRWEDKFNRYAEVFAHPDFPTVTEGRKAFVIIVTPDARRRDLLGMVMVNCLQKQTQDTATLMLDKFWITEKSTLENVDFTAPVWLRPGTEGLKPLVSEKAL